MHIIRDRIKFETELTGTGNIPVVHVPPSLLSLLRSDQDRSRQPGDPFTYTIINGHTWESGTSRIVGDALTRNPVGSSDPTGGKINLPPGKKMVYFHSYL